jgi:CRISPR-associated protein Csc1
MVSIHDTRREEGTETDMPLEIHRALLTLMEHTYFASREVGVLYETEPLIGNYALTYAMGLCHAPYYWKGAPRYHQDLGPLNEQEIYVTPATFLPKTLRYAFSQFNAQTDSYYFRFDQNAIATSPAKRARAANFPQNGKIRMLGIGSQAQFLLINQQGRPLRLPSYIRLGKFASKARIEWERLTLVSERPTGGEHVIDFLLNGADLSPALTENLHAYTVYNIPPAPLLAHCHLEGRFWQCRDSAGKDLFVPLEMRFGVDILA